MAKVKSLKINPELKRVPKVALKKKVAHNPKSKDKVLVKSFKMSPERGYANIIFIEMLMFLFGTAVMAYIRFFAN